MSWPLIRLGDLVSVKGGKRLPKGESYSDEITTHPYIRVTDFKNNSVDMDNLVYISDNIHKKISRYIISHDDLYISIAGTIGLVGVIPKELSGANLTENAAKLVIHDHKKLCKEYLNWYLSTVGQVQIQSKKKVTSQPKLALFRIEEIEIPLPPLAEQKRIAAILDKADAIRQKRKQAIDLADEFLRSVFLDMFGDPVTNPKGWDLKPIVEGVNKITSGWSAKGESRPCENHELGVLKISAVTSGKFKPEENKFVDKGIIPTEKKLICPLKGDLLFSRANTRELVGATCIVPFDSLNTFLPDKLWKVELDSTRLLPEYLHMLLRHEKFRETLTSKATGSSGSMLNISKQKFESTIAPFSSVELQNKFAVLYWKLVHELDLKESSLEKLEQQFKALSQKAFAGEL